MTNPTDIRTEFAVRLTWPDGHVEVNDLGSRRAAEIQTRHINDTKNPTTASAVLVSRTVTSTEWAEV